MIDLDWLFGEDDEDVDIEDPEWDSRWPHSASCVSTGKFKPTIVGQSQALFGLGDLVKENLSTTTLIMGINTQVYEKRFGLIECLAPVKLSKDEPSVYVDKIDWSSFPPMTELAWLFDVFFSKYDREVLMLVGRKRDLTGWLYYVPEQTGSPSQVKWKASDEEMGEFQEQARWIGTIHIHPGESCSPSQTDINDWAEPEKSGLHLVFGRDGSYIISGAIAGKVFPLLDGNISDLDRTTVGYSRSGNRSLEELLKIPKPPKVRKTKIRRNALHIKSDPESQVVQTLQSDAQDYVEDSMSVLGVLKVNPDQMKDLRLVSYKNNWYIMTNYQYGGLGLWCKDTCSTPRSKKLVIKTRRP